MRDPTYVRSEIDANPAWKIAFMLSEHLNNNAPIGWSNYIQVAEVVLKDQTILNTLKVHLTT